MKVRNKPMFWTGLVFQIIQLSGLVIFGLTLLNWDWVTKQVVMSALIILAILMYNGVSGSLMYLGLRKENQNRKNK